MSRKNPVTGSYGKGPRVARRTGALTELRVFAKTRGDRFYSIGIPCRYGHLAGRYTSSAQCVECHDYWFHKRKKSNRVCLGNMRDTNKLRELGTKIFNESAAEREIQEKLHRKFINGKNVHARRARKRKAGGAYSAGDVKKILELQRGKCPVCRVALGFGFHQDHIIPLSAGGSNDKTNIQLLCRDCNQKKHSKHPIDFMQSKGYLL